MERGFCNEVRAITVMNQWIKRADKRADNLLIC